MSSDPPSKEILDAIDSPLDLQSVFRHPDGLAAARTIVGALLKNAAKGAHTIQPQIPFSTSRPLANLDTTMLEDFLAFSDSRNQSSGEGRIRPRDAWRSETTETPDTSHVRLSQHMATASFGNRQQRPFFNSEMDQSSYASLIGQTSSRNPTQHRSESMQGFGDSSFLTRPSNTNQPFQAGQSFPQLRQASSRAGSFSSQYPGDRIQNRSSQGLGSLGSNHNSGQSNPTHTPSSHSSHYRDTQHLQLAGSGNDHGSNPQTRQLAPSSNHQLSTQPSSSSNTSQGLSVSYSPINAYPTFNRQQAEDVESLIVEEPSEPNQLSSSSNLEPLRNTGQLSDFDRWSAFGQSANSRRLPNSGLQSKSQPGNSLSYLAPKIHPWPQRSYIPIESRSPNLSASTTLYKEQSSSKMTPKKRKSESDDKCIAKKPKTDKPAKVKRAKAKAEKKEPAKHQVTQDIWMRIFEFTPPSFLSKARLVSKTWKTYVDNYSSIYVNCRKENFGYDMPPPPEGLTERQYSNLLGGKGCLEPGCNDKHASRTHWSWSKRWCWACWKSKIEREDRVIKSRGNQVGRTVLTKMLECIPVGMHDSFMKPHDYVDDVEVRPRGAPRLYKYYLTVDIDSIIAEYDALTPPAYVEDPTQTAAEKAAALAAHQALMDGLEEKRTAFFDAKKADNDKHMEQVRKIEAGIRMRRVGNREPYDVNRAARRELFTRRAKEELSEIDTDFVQNTKAYKAACRIFRDGGTERGWQTLKPKIAKEWEDSQGKGDKTGDDGNDGNDSAQLGGTDIDDLFGDDGDDANSTQMDGQDDEPVYQSQNTSNYSLMSQNILARQHYQTQGASRLGTSSMNGFGSMQIGGMSFATNIMHGGHQLSNLQSARKNTTFPNGSYNSGVPLNRQITSGGISSFGITQAPYSYTTSRDTSTNHPSSSPSGKSSTQISISSLLQPSTPAPPSNFNSYS